MQMKTKKMAAIAAAAGLMLTGSAWAHGWSSDRAASEAGYATPGTTVFTGNTVQPVVTPYDTMNSPATSTAMSDQSSAASSTSGTSSQVAGYVPPDQAPVDRAEIHNQASAFADLRANASGEDPSYPARQQLFLGTAPGEQSASTLQTQ
jgi:hypothetical protein